MKIQATFGRELLTRKIVNSNYEVSLTSVKPFSGVVEYEPKLAGGRFTGSYEISEGDLSTDAIITLSIPNAEFILLKDGDLKVINFILCKSSEFYDIMENDFHGIKGN